jgi:hypothetical protein
MVHIYREIESVEILNSRVEVVWGQEEEFLFGKGSRKKNERTNGFLFTVFKLAYVD